MAKRKALVLDVDDTMFDTHRALRDILAAHGHTLLPAEGYISTHNCPEDLLDKVLSEARFMVEGKPLHGLESFLNEVADDVDLYLCTHRGYNPLGEEYTDQQLTSYGIAEFFPVERRLFIDPAIHKNKLDFLDTYFPDQPYLLVDDRPVFSAQDELGALSGKHRASIVVFSRLWNIGHYPTSPHMYSWTECSVIYNALLKI